MANPAGAQSPCTPHTEGNAAPAAQAPPATLFHKNCGGCTARDWAGNTGQKETCPHQHQDGGVGRATCGCHCPARNGMCIPLQAAQSSQMSPFQLGHSMERAFPGLLEWSHCWEGWAKPTNMTRNTNQAGCSKLKDTGAALALTPESKHSPALGRARSHQPTFAAAEEGREWRSSQSKPTASGHCQVPWAPFNCTLEQPETITSRSPPARTLLPLLPNLGPPWLWNTSCAAETLPGCSREVSQG